MRSFRYLLGVVFSAGLIWHSVRGADLSVLQFDGWLSAIFSLVAVALCARANVRLSTKQLVQQICLYQPDTDVDLSAWEDARKVVIYGSVLSYTPLPGPVIARSIFLRRKGMSKSEIVRINGWLIGGALLAGFTAMLFGMLLSIDWSVVPPRKLAAASFLAILFLSEHYSRAAVKRGAVLGLLSLFKAQILVYLTAVVSLNVVSGALGIRLSFGACMAAFIAPAFASLAFVLPGGLGVREALLAHFGGPDLQLAGIGVVSLVERTLVLVALLTAYGWITRRRTAGAIGLRER